MTDNLPPNLKDILLLKYETCNIWSLTVKQIKEELCNVNEQVSGNKTIIIDRLVKYYKNNISTDRIDEPPQTNYEQNINIICKYKFEVLLCLQCLQSLCVSWLSDTCQKL